MNEKAKELATAHFDGYVGPTIKAHMPEQPGHEGEALYTVDEVYAMCKHHYLTAAVHFWKHALEDQRETERAAFAAEQPGRVIKWVNGSPAAVFHCDTLKVDGVDVAPVAPPAEEEKRCGFLMDITAPPMCSRESVIGFYTACLTCPAAAKAAPSAKNSPLAPIFARIAAEHTRSLALHQPWQGYTVTAMLKAIAAELAEAELAAAQGNFDETVTELVHVGNVAVKGIKALTERGKL